MSSIAAQRKPFYAWLVPGVFYNQLETVLRDAAFLPGVAKTNRIPRVRGTRPARHASSTLTDGTTVRETVTSATAPDYFRLPSHRVFEPDDPHARQGGPGTMVVH